MFPILVGPVGPVGPQGLSPRHGHCQQLSPHGESAGHERHGNLGGTHLLQLDLCLGAVGWVGWEWMGMDGDLLMDTCALSVLDGEDDGDF